VTLRTRNEARGGHKWLDIDVPKRVFLPEDTAPTSSNAKASAHERASRAPVFEITTMTRFLLV